MEHREILEGLEKNAAYAFDAGDIEIVQTQISSVALAGEFAYKLKKPVRTGFLDFTTLEKRHYFCEREVGLNRRLAPRIYLGVVPVVLEHGVVRIDCHGDPIEYAVKMKRLPQDRMMNALLEEEMVEQATVEEIAGVVAEFHSRAGTGPEIDGYGEPGRLAAELEEDLEEVEAFLGTTITPSILEEIGGYFSGWMEKNSSALERRVAGHRIRDCHGDMHSRNICLPGTVAIFDCIEFNDSFRYIDVAREVAFLAMDLDSYDEPGLAEAYVSRYVELSGDEELLELLDFYKAWLAVVRGKVYSMPLSDCEVSSGERKYSVLRAARYFELANRYAGGRTAPLVLVLMGAMGTGKSAIGATLGKKLHVHAVDSDFVRKSLAGVAPDERQKVGFGEGIYSSEMTEEVYSAMAGVTLEMTKAGYSVILDASFSKEKHRREVMDAAAAGGANVLYVYCTTDLAVLERRLVARERGGKGYSDGRLELLPKQLAEFEDPREVPAGMLMRLDTDGELEELVDQVVERIYQEYGELSAIG